MHVSIEGGLKGESIVEEPGQEKCIADPGQYKEKNLSGRCSKQ